ncbi:MAG: hypothetical protein WBO15_02165 [Gammaproteobacteria bacterium]
MQSSRQTKSADALDGKRRRRLLRDLIVFQFKLLIDAFKDLLLSPLSFGAAIMDFLRPGARPGMLFYRLLRAGHVAEERIDLFGTRRGRVREPESWTVDRAIDQVERRMDRGRKPLKRPAAAANEGEKK